MELTETQRQTLERDGFLVLERVFPPGVLARVTARIERYQQRHEAAIAASGGTQGISRASEITFTSHLAENDPEILEFCRCPELAELGVALLGPAVDLYWNQAVFKMPEGAQQFPWHQDDGYTPVTPSPYLTLWIALNDATVENGCVWVLPGSHKQGLVEHEQTPIGLACYSLDEPNQGIPVPVPAGSIVAFWSLTMHKSGVNVSQGCRKAYIVQLARAGLVSLRTGEPVPNLLPIARAGESV
jgi:ectoine hydroxylase-related dioxygenase (phytanoyl-CoA dioxygenase family)